MSEPTRETQTIRRFLELLFQPGDVFEVRAPDCREQRNARYAFTCSGYFTFESIDAAVREIGALDDSGTAPGIYATINPATPSLLARAANRIKTRARETTQDKDILCRRWLLIDVDPVRPAGVSSTNAELALALDRASTIAEYLTSLSWPAPIVAMSGNGYHLLYHIDMATEDDSLVKTVLAALAARFSDDAVAVDRAVHNPARIVKVIGTVSRKGDDLRGIPGLEDRPHRRSEFIDVPAVVDVVPVAQLTALAEPNAKQAAQNAPRANVAAPVANVGDRFDCSPAGVRAWLETHGVAVKGERRNGDKTLLLLERCPIDPEIVSSGGSDIAVMVGDDGMLSYCNKHNRGQHYTWHDLRRALDPGWQPPPEEASDVDLSAFKPLVAGQPAFTEPPTIWELIQRYPKLRDPVIHGLLRRGETMNIIAASKTNKSWLANDLALAVATGRPWLETFPTEPGEVLIVDNELHCETSAYRLPKVADARGIVIGDYGHRIRVQNMRGQLRDLFSLSGFFNTLEPGRFRIVILDALYRFMPRDMDENDNGTMASLYNHLDCYADRLGCCFVVIHHTSKGNQSGKSITDVGAGAGSQSRATDTHVILRPHEESDVAVLDAAVRSWPPVASRCLRWTCPVWMPANDLDPAMLRSDRPGRRREEQKQEAPDPARWTAEQFVGAFISEVPTTKPQIREATKDQPGLSWRRVSDLLDIAESQGLVYRWSTGRAHRVLYATVPQPAEEETHS